MSYKRNLADNWTRTSTLLLEVDFESTASTNSAISAWAQIILKIYFSCHGYFSASRGFGGGTG